MYIIYHLFVYFYLLASVGNAISANNICTFKTSGKFFSLVYLQNPNHYVIDDDDNEILYFDFCAPFLPAQCPNESTAFSFLIKRNSENSKSYSSVENFTCERYSSNSTTSLFHTKYEQSQDTEGTLTLVLLNKQHKIDSPVEQLKQTIIKIKCSNREQLFIHEYKTENNQIIIEGDSYYGCPVFQMSSLWKVFINNKIAFGIVMFLIGFYLLFYGRSAIDITVFIAAFLISLLTLGSIITLFVSPNSSSLVIYSTFLFLLFVSCLLGYSATKLIRISVFLVGALFGIMLGIMVSAIFSKLFDIYEKWPLILFTLIFSIPFGFLTFKYHDKVIIASTSFTGSYLFVRPFSWIFGGYPNQLLLYKAVQASEIKELPWTFFIYFFIIILLAVVGGMYQKLKLHRKYPNEQIEINIIQQSIERPIDALKVHVDKLIQKFRSQKPEIESEYHPLDQNNKKPTTKNSSQLKISNF